MTALAVIEPVDVVKHHWLGLVVRRQILPLDQVGFEGVQAALGHGVVPTVALPAHTGLQPVRGEELPIALGAILTATLGMHQEAGGGRPLTDRHRQCLGPQRCPQMVGQRPSAHCSGAQSQHHGERSPAFPRGQVGHIPNVDFIWRVHREPPVQLVRHPRRRLP
jgi:hypothetical protein